MIPSGSFESTKEDLVFETELFLGQLYSHAIRNLVIRYMLKDNDNASVLVAAGADRADTHPVIKQSSWNNKMWVFQTAAVLT